MRKLTQYFPNYISGFKPQSFLFNTAAEILDIPFVKLWSKDLHKSKNVPTGEKWQGIPVSQCVELLEIAHKFHRFSLSENRLMAEYDEGKVWYVIGIVDNVEGLDLPKWEPKK